MNPAIKEIAAHAAHCCIEHGCKYGDSDCPVVMGLVGQLYPCEECDEAENKCNPCSQAVPPTPVFENQVIPGWILTVAAGEHKKQEHDPTSIIDLCRELVVNPEQAAHLWMDAERREKGLDPYLLSARKDMRKAELYRKALDRLFHLLEVEKAPYLQKSDVVQAIFAHLAEEELKIADKWQ